MVLNPVISKLAGKLVVLASASPRRREILTNVVRLAYYLRWVCVIMYDFMNTYLENAF